MNKTIGVVPLAIMLAGCGVSSACDLKIESPWIRQPPPGATTLSAYATLRNTGAGAIQINDVISAASGMAMFHETTVSGGLARMRSLDILPIPAGGKVILAPHGKHVMLMDIRVTPKPGDHLTIGFKDTSGCVTSADFIVTSGD